MAIFGNKIRRQGPQTPLDTLVSDMQAVLQGSGSSMINPTTAAAAFGLESLQDHQVAALENSTQSLQASVTAIAGKLGIKLSAAQEEAAVAAGVMAGDIGGFMKSTVLHPVVSTESMVVVGGAPADAVPARIANEAYDLRENRDAPLFSIIYNMQSSRQDDFGEAFYPTIVVTPDNVGFAITVQMVYVYDGVQRSISGAVDQYKKKNVLRAVADPTILKNEQTRLIPVYRTEAADKFVDPALVAARDLILEGETIKTAPLAVGKKLSLLGISQTDALLRNGIMTETDAIDPAIDLAVVYIKVGDDVLKVNVQNLPYSNFVAAPQAHTRLQQLNFETDSVLLNKSSTRADGSALTTLKAIVDNDYIVRVSLNVTGSVNVELGDTQVFGNRVAAFTVQNSAGEQVSLASGSAKAVADILDAAEIIGYELKAYRTNSNRRTRGQLIDTTKFTQVYQVPLRSPITAIHPVTTDGQTDSSDLNSLILTTRVRTSNAAVTALLESSALLKDYVDARDFTGEGPAVLGVGRYYVRPTFFSEAVDVAASIDSLKSHERAQDISAVLINKIRDYAYRMYRDSEYKIAADAINGGISQVPTVIIGADPVTVRYLTLAGDVRTLGDEFQVKIVESYDYRVAGKVFVTFGVFNEQRNTVPNPLNFGNMAWTPELSVVLPMTRDGQISKELAVSPRFRHINHLPVLTVLDVSNIPNALDKVPVAMKAV